VVSQALGGWSERWRTTQYVAMAGIGPTHTVIVRKVSDCGDVGRQVEVIDNATGQNLVTHSAATGETFTVSPLPSCSNITAVNAEFGVYVADSLHKKILYLQSTALSWSEVTSTPGINISKLMIGTSTIYWQDSTGIYMAPRTGGGPRTTLSTAANTYLLGVDYGDAYLQAKVGTQYELRKVVGPNLSVTTLRTQSDPYASLSFDENNFYWVENLGTHRLRQMTKSGSSISTVHSSIEVFYLFPKANNGLLYWIELDGSTHVSNLRRKNLSNGNHVTVTLPDWDDYQYFTLTPTNTFMLVADASPLPAFVGLFRGTL